MAGILVQHQVKDFAAWKKVFDAHNDFRVASGALSGQVFRDANDPKKVVTLFTWDTLDKAQKFAQSTELKEAMAKAGVEGPPNVSFLNEA